MFTGDTHRRMRVGSFYGSIASLYLNKIMLDFLKDIKGNPKGLGFVQMFKLPFTDQENNQMIMFLPIYFNNDGKGVTVVTE